jgi:hypothetical protein
MQKLTMIVILGVIGLDGCNPFPWAASPASDMATAEDAILEGDRKISEDMTSLADATSLIDATDYAKIKRNWSSPNKASCDTDSQGTKITSYDESYNHPILMIKNLSETDKKLISTSCYTVFAVISPGAFKTEFGLSLGSSGSYKFKLYFGFGVGFGTGGDDHGQIVVGQFDSAKDWNLLTSTKMINFKSGGTFPANEDTDDYQIKMTIQTDLNDPSNPLIEASLTRVSHPLQNLSSVSQNIPMPKSVTIAEIGFYVWSPSDANPPILKNLKFESCQKYQLACK